MAYSPNSQKKYNSKMYFATAKLNPDKPEDAVLIDKLENYMKENTLTRQAAIKKLIERA